MHHLGCRAAKVVDTLIKFSPVATPAIDLDFLVDFNEALFFSCP